MTAEIRVPLVVLRAQRVWRRWVQLPYWTLRCMVLHELGRFFVFRAAPDWFVYFVGRQATQATDPLAAFIHSGRDEFLLRRHRKARAV